MTTDKPLHPLTHGNILIVGAKASNFDEELKTHPRIIMWDSQHESWTHKDLPHNTQAVFVTRFIGHTAFAKILAEARKKKITMFNPEGTGQIVKQVKELLDIREVESIPTVEEPQIMRADTKVQMKRGGPTVKGYSKLTPLMQFIDPNKTAIANAHFMFEKAKEMGIETTVLSIANKVSAANRKRAFTPRPGNTIKSSETTRKHVDVVVEILDNMVKELQDMREFLVATTEENKELKARFEMFKKAFND